MTAAFGSHTSPWTVSCSVCSVPRRLPSLRPPSSEPLSVMKPRAGRSSKVALEATGCRDATDAGGTTTRSVSGVVMS